MSIFTYNQYVVRQYMTTLLPKNSETSNIKTNAPHRLIQSKNYSECDF
jgi:hypothetical protein